MPTFEQFLNPALARKAYNAPSTVQSGHAPYKHSGVKLWVKAHYLFDGQYMSQRLEIGNKTQTTIHHISTRNYSRL